MLHLAAHGRQVQGLLEHDERERGDRAGRRRSSRASRAEESTMTPPMSGPLTVARAKTAPM